MPRLVNRNPKYTQHKASGQAVVTIDGEDVYLGTYGTKASRDEYDRIIGEWLANGRRLHTDKSITVNQLVLAFKEHAETYYRHADGTPTNEVKNYRYAVKPLRRLYGNTAVNDFGPLKLEAVRNEMIRMGWTRTRINRDVRRLQYIFRWGAQKEMVPGEVRHAVDSLEGLKAGRSKAKESKPVPPVPLSTVRATLPYLSRIVGAMVRVQLLTGCRPGEVCGMRTGEIDRTGPVWLYKPAQHKTAHHGHQRVVYIVDEAKAILEPFLKLDPNAYLFSPAEADAERREVQHRARVEGGTPLSCGNAPGTNVKSKPRKKPGKRYAVESYAHAIYNGCIKAFGMPEDLRKAPKRKDAQGNRIPETQHEKAERLAKAKAWRAEHCWHPHQLRHTSATELRREFGAEAAQLGLGLQTLPMVEIYGERNRDKATGYMRTIAKQITSAVR